jgi:hypothetical protein
MTLDHIKQISIHSYLEEQGINPVHQNNMRLYHSPLRKDTNASFSVSDSNLWFDHGLGIGGSIIDLVAHIENCSIGEAITKLEKDNFSFHRTHIIPNEKTNIKPAIEIVTITELKSPALLDYLRSRRIDIQIAKAICHEVHYKVKDKTYYFAIGYKNDREGFELRSKYFKGCISKDVTTIKTGQEDCLLFEGFFDYLSYLTITKKENPTTDIIVLNSLSNLSKVKSSLSTYRNVFAFLDNDTAGVRAIQDLKESLYNVIDQSTHYPNHKDLNEYLCSEMSFEKCSIEISCK